MEELLGVPSLASARALAPASPASEAAGGRGGTLVEHAEAEEEYDLPEPTTPLPPEVVLEGLTYSVQWYLQCKINMKSIAFGVRNAELNPRRGRTVVLRLFNPRATVTICPNGYAAVRQALISEEEGLMIAAKVTRMVQKCGHPDAKCSGLRVAVAQASATLRFPVRLESLAEKWRRHVLYEPEVTSKAYFFIKKPRCTVGVSSAGKLRLSGFRDKAHAQEALRRTYPIFLEFNR